MTMLQTAMKNAGIYSIEALGKSLCERYPDFDSLKARSVSVKLGLLNQGNTSWWLKRPEFVEKLTELLCCAPQDLGLHFSAKAPGLYEFEDFPELPPLDLSRDTPCEIGYFAKDDDSTPEEELKPWFGQAPFGRMARALPLGVSWLYFPRGTGKDIFWARLTALSPFECKSALSVASMANRLKQAKPICLNVSDSSGERDLLALANRHKDCSVLVCAPFDLPERNNSEYFEHLTWKYHKESPEGRSQLMLTNPKVAAFEGGADRYKWRLYKNWRSLLLQWIERRLASHPDTLFDAKNLQSWLCGFSDQTLFDTPRSLIALCRFAHRYGHRALPSPGDQNAGKKLLDLLTDEPLEYREAYVELIKDWLATLDLPWGGWLTGSRWREIAASADQQKTHDLLNQMVEADDATKRMAIAQKARTQLSTSNRVNLIDSRFLLQNEAGDVMLSPRFLADLVARDWICHQILETPHTNWGTLCFDSFRRELIKEAFDLLTIKEIAECASTVIRSYRENAAGIGATEAIFAAIGRRTLAGERLPQSLLSIADIVIRRMMLSDQFEPSPWSLGYEEMTWWQPICWTWSLAIATPSQELPIEWSTFFPAWFDNPQDGIWAHIVLSTKDHTPFEYLATAEKYLLERAKDVAQIFPSPPTSLSEAFAPYLISRAIKEGREIPGEWWQVILKKSWAEDLLLAELEEIGQPATTCLIKLSDAAIQIPLSEDKRIDWITISRSRVWQWMLERSDAKLFIAHLDDEGLAFIWYLFPYLPTNYQIEILGRFRNHEKWVMRWWDIVMRLTGDHVDAVIPWLGVDDDHIGYMVGLWLWGGHQKTTEALLMGNTSHIIKRRLIFSAHSTYSGTLTTLIQVLKSEALLSPEELRDLVLRFLPCSAGLAPKLISLMEP